MKRLQKAKQETTKRRALKPSRPSAAPVLYRAGVDPADGKTLIVFGVLPAHKRHLKL